jgi:hypothetical protein
MTRKLLLTGTALYCVMGLSSCAGKTKVYERHVEPAYDAHGQVRPGYATLNLEFLNALNDDLEACYKGKQP